MTARSRMTHRALVERGTSPGVDDYDNPQPAEWATHIAALPCFLYGSTEREAVTDERTAVVSDLKLMVPLSADVTEQDRINQIVDRRGTVIEPGTLHVEEVLYRRSHRLVTLSRVTA